MSKGVRRTGRELALKVLYSLLDQEQRTVVEVLDDFWASFRFREDVLGEALDEVTRPVPPEVRSFAEGLVIGVVDHLEEVDETIARFSTNWSLERMARVDLSLLRLGTYELLHRSDVPASVVINEAIEIGKSYGTAETQAFVNGVLDKISKVHRQDRR